MFFDRDEVKAEFGVAAGSLRQHSPRAENAAASIPGGSIPAADVAKPRSQNGHSIRRREMSSSLSHIVLIFSPPR
jgi:hypothetical protein